MPQLILFNKPFQVLSQFTDERQAPDKPRRTTLARWINTADVYPAGRLDYDSEGLLLLTDDGQLQNRIASPKTKLEKVYWVQVEGQIELHALKQLQKGVQLKDGSTLPARARAISEPDVWQRDPPVRSRQTIPTSWLELSITEGRNRQVRRMTAAVGFPTLRLIRYQIGEWSLGDLQPGQFTTTIVPSAAPRPKPRFRRGSDRRKKLYDMDAPRHRCRHR